VRRSLVGRRPTPSTALPQLASTIAWDTLLTVPSPKPTTIQPDENAN